MKADARGTWGWISYGDIEIIVVPPLQGRHRTWVGLDSGDEKTALCATDQAGTLLLQCEVPSKTKAIHSALEALNGLPPFSIAMESCSTSTALAKALRKLGYDVAAFDCDQIHRFLSIRRNKTDANDARGIAEVGRLGSDYLTQVPPIVFGWMYGRCDSPSGCRSATASYR